MREKVHAPYIDIAHYQHLARVDDDAVSAVLGCSVRTYKEKITGYSDFTGRELMLLAGLFNVGVDALVATA